MSDKIYTLDEAFHMFINSDLKPEFISVIRTRFDAMAQAMINAVECPEKTMKLVNARGDIWLEEHNRVVEVYQRYYDNPFDTPILPKDQE